MSDTPDISKIVSMIMENPSLIAQISAMANGNTEKEETEKVELIAEEQPAAPVMATEAEPRRAQRARLLGAMKPYLSKERARAIDTMMSIADILEVSRRR